MTEIPYLQIATDNLVVSCMPAPQTGTVRVRWRCGQGRNGEPTGSFHHHRNPLIHSGFELAVRPATALKSHRPRNASAEDLQDAQKSQTITFMNRSTSLAMLMSLILMLISIAAHAHVPEGDFMPGKRIRTTWIDENRDEDELYRMYLGESPVMEMREDGSHRIYVYGDGRLLATADYAGPVGEPEIHYYLMDHLGSTIAVLDEEGHTVWPAPGSNPDGYQKYQPYGEFASDPGELGSRIPSFTGKFADPGTGNHYFNARYHTSDTGTTKGPMQFSSPDPIYGNLTDPLSWNRYAYCRNNPIMYTDPDGRKIKINILENTPGVLSAQDRILLFEEFSKMTGYAVDDFYITDGGYLEINPLAQAIGGSITARDKLHEWINTAYEVKLHNDPSGKLGIASHRDTSDGSGQIRLNFSQIADIDYGSYIDPLTFGVGAIFFHEGFHAFDGYNDPGNELVSYK